MEKINRIMEQHEIDYLIETLQREMLMNKDSAEELVKFLQSPSHF